MPNSARRCVFCGLQEKNHQNGTCPSGTTAFATRDLPEGYACRDCEYFARFCREFIGLFGHETACDWYPSRFTTIQPKVKNA
jgi:hypothetical protein